MTDMTDMNGNVSGMENTNVLSKTLTSSRNRNSYPSNTYGEFIVNAETGIQTTHTVGSSDEYLYYKVVSDGNMYFYDSPEHYVRHRFTRMRYRSKNRQAFKYEKIRKDEMLENRSNTLIHWSLVDSNGQNTEDKNHAFMIPHVNTQLTAPWVSRRAQHIANRKNVTTEDE